VLIFIKKNSAMQDINLEQAVLGTIPIINPAVISRNTFDDSLILVNCDTGKSLNLNYTGMIIWGLIDGKRNPEEIALQVCEHFTEVPESVTEDVSDLLYLFYEDGFIGYELKL